MAAIENTAGSTDPNHVERCDGPDCTKRGDWYPLYEGEERRGYKIPDGMKACGDCAKKLNEHTADDMTDAELIAAIMDESDGYAGPTHAMRHVQDYRKGREAIEAEGGRYGCWCERGSACFKNDLDALIERARFHWLFTTPEKRERLLTAAQRWQEAEAKGGPAVSMGISCAYPTNSP